MLTKLNSRLSLLGARIAGSFDDAYKRVLAGAVILAVLAAIVTAVYAGLMAVLSGYNGFGLFVIGAAGAVAWPFLAMLRGMFPGGHADDGRDDPDAVYRDEMIDDIHHKRSFFDPDATSVAPFNTTAAPGEGDNKVKQKTPANKMKNVPRPR